MSNVGITIQLTSQSTYNVDFSVDSPTLFSLSGSISGSGTYTPGMLATIEANVTLSQVGQLTPLYSVSEAYGQGTGLTFYGFNFSFTDPLLFSTTLVPGQTYTLNAQAYNSEVKWGARVGGADPGPATAGFSFIASVPEPSMFCLFAFAIPFATRRKGRNVARCPGVLRDLQRSER